MTDDRSAVTAPSVEPKVQAASLGAVLTGAAVSLITWAALRYLGVELTEVQAMAIVTAAAAGAARLFGWLKRSPTSATSEGFHPTVAAEALRDHGLDAAANRLQAVE